jgi:iron complex transport system ATP-binding protein
MQIVERLNATQGVTVLMTSHDLNLAAEFCRRLLVLDGGRVVADGTPREVLREDLLRDVYACEMRVQADDYTGGVLVTPARRLTRKEGGRTARLHVVAGGGCGEEILRRLSLCGYRLSCGVLNRQDTDALAAEALGTETALEQPFSPISAEALACGHVLANAAEAVIVCEVPFGAGNLANLVLAEQALTEEKPVFVNTRNLAARDFTGGQATARITALVQGGATLWQSPTELAELLDRALGGASTPSRA